MKIYEEVTEKKAETIVIQLSMKEAQALIEMADAACNANKKKPSWKAIHKALELMPCFFIGKGGKVTTS